MQQTVYIKRNYIPYKRLCQIYGAKKRSATQSLGTSAFDDAMRRLVRVPKAEVNAEEKKYRNMRKRLQDKKANRKRQK